MFCFLRCFISNFQYKSEKKEYCWKSRCEKESKDGGQFRQVSMKAVLVCLLELLGILSVNVFSCAVRRSLLVIKLQVIISPSTDKIIVIFIKIQAKYINNKHKLMSALNWLHRCGCMVVLLWDKSEVGENPPVHFGDHQPFHITKV